MPLWVASKQTMVWFGNTLALSSNCLNRSPTFLDFIARQVSRQWHQKQPAANVWSGVPRGMRLIVKNVNCLISAGVGETGHCVLGPLVRERSRLPRHIQPLGNPRHRWLILNWSIVQHRPKAYPPRRRPLPNKRQ